MKMTVNESEKDINMGMERKSEFDIAKAIAIYSVVVGHVRNNVLFDIGGYLVFSHAGLFLYQRILC